jgi:Protein of unknown function (DUF2817)
MTRSDALDCFAASYAEARAKFQLAVAKAGGQLSTYVHPSAVGPDGGSLAIDVACFGPVDAAKAFLIVSGTHGGEGYTGSAAQIALLGTGALARAPVATRVVLLHAINPYGFAHWTRTTENNVDLNRNFVDFSGRLPRNDAYLEVHDAICPRDWSESARAAAQRELDAWIARHGQQAWMQAIMMGQYDEPTGLNYGGRAPEWSHRTLQGIVARHLPAVKKLAFIDWHTGLGQPGQPFFLCFNAQGDANWERACGWWGRDRIESSGGYAGAKRPRYSGLIFYGVQRLVAPADMTGAVIEFGTLPVSEAFEQLRVDRWLKFGDTPDDPRLLASLRSGVGDAFTPPEPEWRRGVIDHAIEIQLQGLAGLAAW